MNGEKKARIKNIVLLILWTAVMTVSCRLYIDFGGIEAEKDSARHISQIAMIALFVSGFMALRTLWKLIPREKYERVAKRVKAAIRRAIDRIYETVSKIATKLGIGSGKKYAFGVDEYSFIDADEAKNARRLSMAGVTKWDKLTNNSERIRFLFIRFMGSKIRRGYRRRGKTHMEWCADLKASGDELELFNDYGAARYGGDTVDIPDSSVDRALRLVDHKKSSAKRNV